MAPIVVRISPATCGVLPLPARICSAPISSVTSVKIARPPASTTLSVTHPSAGLAASPEVASVPPHLRPNEKFGQGKSLPGLTRGLLHEAAGEVDPFLDSLQGVSLLLDHQHLDRFSRGGDTRPRVPGHGDVRSRDPRRRPRKSWGAFPVLSDRGRSVPDPDRPGCSRRDGKRRSRRRRVRRSAWPPCWRKRPRE